MFDKAPEHGGLKFRSGFVVNRHDLVSLFRGMMRTRRAALAKWIPVRSDKCEAFAARSWLTMENTGIRWGTVTDFSIS
jgi:hypothetical protein